MNLWSKRTPREDQSSEPPKQAGAAHVSSDAVEVHEAVQDRGSPQKPAVPHTRETTAESPSDPLTDLLRIVLGDIQEWSRRNGYDSIPPALLLRQLADLADNLGRAFGRL